MQNGRKYRVSVNLNELEFKKLEEISHMKGQSLSKTCVDAVRRQIYVFGEEFSSPNSKVNPQ